MPDETNNLNPANSSDAAIRTQAELEAARAKAAQLERDLAGINRTNADYEESEALLGDISNAIAKFQRNVATNPPPPAPAPAAAETPATNAPGANSPPANQVIAPAPIPGVEVPLTPPQINAPPPVVTGAAAPAAPPPASSNPPPQTPAPGSPPGSDGPMQDQEAATFPLIGGPPGARTDLLQISAEQIRRAFELNTQSQMSLYERMLELLDQQNRKLGELDRKTSELTNQIKSLKNP